MRPIGDKPRRLRTLAGEIEFLRPTFACPDCRRSVAPLDAELGAAQGEHMTLRVVRKVAYSCAESSFSRAAKDLLELADLSVSAAECARVANEVGARFDELEREREEKWAEPVATDRPVAPAEIECGILVLQADSVAVLTVQGEDHKMVHCGRAYGLDANGETAAGRAVITQSRYTGSAEDYADFRHRLDALGNRMGARSAKTILFLADGADKLWEIASTVAPNAVHIQDIRHVLERLSKLSKVLWGESEKARETYEAWALMLKESRMDELLAALEDVRKGRRGEKRKAVDGEIEYLGKGRHRMDYARYEREGWPIGSGAIEGTCKHLVKERFAKTGARWRRGNIKNVLALRLARFNEEWERLWGTLREEIAA